MIFTEPLKIQPNSSFSHALGLVIPSLQLRKAIKLTITEEQHLCHNYMNTYRSSNTTHRYHQSNVAFHHIDNGDSHTRNHYHIWTAIADKHFVLAELHIRKKIYSTISLSRIIDHTVQYWSYCAVPPKKATIQIQINSNNLV